MQLYMLVTFERSSGNCLLTKQIAASRNDGRTSWSSTTLHEEFVHAKYSSILLENRVTGRAGRAESINIRYFCIIQNKTCCEQKYVPSTNLTAYWFTKPIREYVYNSENEKCRTRTHFP